MRKSQQNSKRVSAAILSALLLMSTCNPAICQTANDDSTKPATNVKTEESKLTEVKPTSPDAKTPEADSRSASDTVWSLDSKLEKKAEQNLDKPQPEPKMPSGDDLLNKMKDQFPSKVDVPTTQTAPSTPQTGTASTTPKNLGPTPVDPATVLMQQPDAGKPGASQPSMLPANNQGVTIEPTPAQAAAKAAAAKEAAKPMQLSASGTLTGRIEQISGEGEVKMPVLKMQAAVLDPRGKLLPAEIEKYSGTIAKAFPTDFRGLWGGTLQIWSYRYSPDYLTVDRAEAISSAKVLQPKRSGAVNFNFYNDRSGQVALQPPTVLLSVPLKDTNSYSQMTSGGGQMGAFGGMFDQMMGNMEAPVVGIHFGTAAASAMEKGVSGNDFNQVVAKNVIRALGPGVLEQQIVTKYTTRTTAGKTSNGFDESVMRFKKLDNNRLYVLCASVKYSHSGKYLSKLIMYGTVDRGRRMNTDPMGGMNSMMGGMDLNAMQKLMGGGMGGRGPINVPHGGFGGLPGMGGMQIPGGSGGAGGAPNLNDIMKQLNNQLNGSR